MLHHHSSNLSCPVQPQLGMISQHRFHNENVLRGHCAWRRCADGRASCCRRRPPWEAERQRDNHTDHNITHNNPQHVCFLLVLLAWQLGPTWWRCEVGPIGGWSRTPPHSKHSLCQPLSSSLYLSLPASLYQPLPLSTSLFPAASTSLNQPLSSSLYLSRPASLQQLLPLSTNYFVSASTSLFQPLSTTLYLPLPINF